MELLRRWPCGAGALALLFALASNGLAAEPRIAGGREVDVPAAGVARFPWMVQLLRSANPLSAYCGGTLVTPDHVLTAAHCVVPAGGGVRPTHVTVGATDLERPATSGERIPVRRVISNPDFDSGSFDGDVALLELARPASTDRLIRVTRTAFADGAPATVIGFGATGEDGPLSNHLRRISVPLVSPAACRDALAPFGLAITARMVCAGLATGGRDACTGDSGGPLFVRTGDGEPVQIGVVSFGVGCARPGLPGVYARPEALEGFLRTALALESTAGLARSALTGNQRALARTLDRNRRAFDRATLDAYVDLLLQSDPDRRRSLDSLSPYAMLAALDITRDGLDATAVALRRRAAMTLAGGGPEAEGARSGPSHGEGGQGGLRPFASVGWRRADAASGGSLPGLEAGTGHVVAGVDAALGDHVAAGLALSHLRARARERGVVDAKASQVAINAFAMLRPAPRGRFAASRVEVSAGVARVSQSVERTLFLGAGRARSSGRANGYALVASIAATHPFDLGWRLSPYGALDVAYINLASYTETGARGFSLRVDPGADTSVTSRLGARIETAWRAPGAAAGLVVRPHATVEWRREHAADDASAEVRLAAVPGARFVSRGATRDRAWVEVEAGFVLETSDPGISVGFGYRRAVGRRGAARRSVSGDLRLAW